MSYIAFATQSDGEVLLRGAERAYMSTLVADTAKVGISQDDQAVLHAMMPGMRREFEQLGYGQSRLNRSLMHAALIHGHEPLFRVDGEPADSFQLVLNTALVLGSDLICLAARLHAQCEIHAYVEGPNRAWLADLIQQGLDAGIYREGVRWNEVQELLRLSDAEPVVTYSSFADHFPNSDVADWEPPRNFDAEPDWDAWHDLFPADQWRLALVGLRAQGAKELEIRPDALRVPYGHSKTLFDVFKERL